MCFRRWHASAHRTCTVTRYAARCAAWAFKAVTPRMDSAGMSRTVARERLGADIDVLEAQLAHAKKGDVQKAYDRTTFGDDRRRVYAGMG